MSSHYSSLLDDTGCAFSFDQSVSAASVGHRRVVDAVVDSPRGRLPRDARGCRWRRRGRQLSPPIIVANRRAVGCTAQRSPVRAARATAEPRIRHPLASAWQVRPLVQPGALAVGRGAWRSGSGVARMVETPSVASLPAQAIATMRVPRCAKPIALDRLTVPDGSSLPICAPD